MDNLSRSKIWFILDKMNKQLNGFKFRMIDGVGHYKASGMDEYEPICHGGGGGEDEWYTNFPPIPERYKNDPSYRAQQYALEGRIVSTGAANTVHYRHQFSKDFNSVIVLSTGAYTYSSYTINAPFHFILNEKEFNPILVYNSVLRLGNTTSTRNVPSTCLYLFSNVYKKDVIEIDSARLAKKGATSFKDIKSVDYIGDPISNFEVHDYSYTNEIILDKDYKIIIVICISTQSTNVMTISCNIEPKNFVLYTGDVQYGSTNGVFRNSGYLVGTSGSVLANRRQEVAYAFGNCKKGDVIRILQLNTTATIDENRYIEYDASTIEQLILYGVN